MASDAFSQSYPLEAPFGAAFPVPRPDARPETAAALRARTAARRASELDGNIIDLVDHIIERAIDAGASDIHIEPGRETTAVRFRQDGVLRNVFTIPRKAHLAVIGRFKVLAGLKSDEHRRPQDGRIEPQAYPETSLRISTIPTLFGEKVTLRVMDDLHRQLSIEELGFSAAQRDTIRRNVEKPFGMVVTSGPTGAGKTTTLYALLNLLRSEGVNISTLEDPIEFALSGVNQVQINPAADLKFSSGLRSLLRQDPDIIMVGEVRDSETAVMAANAAMTGHLVLTTLHTNDAPSAVTRLLEMKVEEFVVGSVLNAVIAQRLVRRICDSCATLGRLDPVLVRKVSERKDILQALEARSHGSAKTLARQGFVRGRGCEACSGTGYRGRLGIYEVLEMTKSVHDLVLQHADPARIKAAAEKAGFRDMRADGIDKVFAGLTTFEEVLRTTRNV